MPPLKTNFQVGNKLIPVSITVEEGRMYFKFGFNRPLQEEIKASFEGRKWHGFEEPPRKQWSAPITQRNLFVLRHLRGEDVYERFDASPVQFATSYDLYEHQVEMIGYAMATNHFIWGAEMGLGKTLAAFIVMELSGFDDWFWIGPRSALRAVRAEITKWNFSMKPRLMTYEGLKKVISDWEPGVPSPRGIIFDESSKIKTPTAQRSVAARHIADAIRDEYAYNSYIGLLSGAPAPKSPGDWWHQCEVACPGFVREGSIFNFRKRLGIFIEEEGIPGTGTFNKLVTWKDDSSKCSVCGLVLTDHANEDHAHTNSVNEVAGLYDRMDGLVHTWLKKDCLDLPELHFEVINCPPSAETLRAAELIVSTSTRAIQAFTLLRELSDGFQYVEVRDGDLVCELCHGDRVYFDPAIEKEITCPSCFGKGVVPRMVKNTLEVECPKLDSIGEQLELHEDVGRLNVYAGFRASIDRVTNYCLKQKWAIIRADGRGWFGVTPEGIELENDRLLDLYQNGHEHHPRMVFCGQPGAAGMGLTLTASPTTVFYSNDFNADSRIQAEARGHRIGMDIIRGGRIIDLVHLPSDQYVLDNLKLKKDLLKMSMTGIEELYESNQAKI